MNWDRAESRRRSEEPKTVRTVLRKWLLLLLLLLLIAVKPLHNAARVWCVRVDLFSSSFSIWFEKCYVFFLHSHTHINAHTHSVAKVSRTFHWYIVQFTQTNCRDSLPSSEDSLCLWSYAVIMFFNLFYCFRLFCCCCSFRYKLAIVTAAHSLFFSGIIRLRWFHFSYALTLRVKSFAFDGIVVVILLGVFFVFWLVDESSCSWQFSSIVFGFLLLSFTGE